MTADSAPGRPRAGGSRSDSSPGDSSPGDSSPAQRYADSRRRAAADRTELARFALDYPFGLDDFQVKACQALEAGRGVLVAAPTGSGKTVVGEFAVHLALATGRKAFYTTPIKALSNQKYTDLVARHGAERVGLLTGDNTVNGEAPVVVMTTEVLRNMLYAGSHTLTDLGFVVMDEVHYLADRFRGAVWEEVIIHLPESVQLASLSATVSNAEEFGAWLAEVRGDTEIVVSEHRPVPLWQHVLVGRQLYDLFGKRGVNPELLRVAERDRAERGATSWRGGRGRRGRDSGPPRGGRRGPGRADVLITLDQANLLPAITFIFSRAGCDAAVSQCLSAGLWLTTTEEREKIRAEVDRRCAAIPPEDLDVLGFWSWREALERGVAAHHAGLLPTFKEVVEELVAAGLVKAVFATETLALGINVPARSVVLEKLVKWNGETHAEVTPGEYTQLTGRAGRRGIDVEGHAVVLWQSGLDPEAVAGLASTRTYPLRSSFRPTYNMAVNLVDQVGRNRAREILETSFAQFQADRAVVGLSRQLQRHDEALAGYSEAMTCHLGDFAEYMGLRRAIAERETALSRRDATDRHAAAQESLQQLRRGDVVRLPSGRRTGWAVVIDVGGPGQGAPLTVLTVDRHVHRLNENELTHALTPLTRVPVPASFSARSPQSRRDLASTLRNALGAADGHPDGSGRRARRRAAAADDAELGRLRARMRAHPCHGCAEREDHARWAERHQRLTGEAATLRRRIDGRTSSIARTFDRVCELLDERGYLAGETVTTAGQRLKRIYGESDLLVAECLREGLWSGLDAAALAACVSAVVYSARGDDRGQGERQIPNPKLREALAQTSLAWAGLEEAERRIGLDVTREVDLGLVTAMHRWARGQALERVLADGDLSAGDFVRWCRQVIDLLGQIQSAAADAPDGQALRSTAQQAIEAVRRGVVAFSSVA